MKGFGVLNLISFPPMIRSEIVLNPQQLQCRTSENLFRMPLSHLLRLECLDVCVLYIHICAYTHTCMHTQKCVYIYIHTYKTITMERNTPKGLKNLYAVDI